MASPAPSPTSRPPEWTAEEEDLVIQHTRTHGLGRWDEVGALLPTKRSGVATYGHWIGTDLWTYADRDEPGAMDEGVGWCPREDADLVRNVLKLGEKGKRGRISVKLQTARTPESCEARWFGVMKAIHVPRTILPKPRQMSKPTPRSAASTSSNAPPGARTESHRSLSYPSSSTSTSSTSDLKRAHSPSPSPSASSKKPRNETANPTPPSTPGARLSSLASPYRDAKKAETQTSMRDGVEAETQTSLPRGVGVGTQISLPNVAGMERRTESREERYREMDRLWGIAKEGLLKLVAS